MKTKKASPSCDSYALASLWLLSGFLLVYFLRTPSLAAESVRAALNVCAVGLIPSLFPFIVLVSVINLSGLSGRISRAVGRPLGWIFGIDSSAASAILLGALGGFPIGAVCALELYKNGSATSSDAERLITFTNNASPAFCIGTVGAALFGSVHFGVRLYVCQLLSAVIIGILQRKRERVRSGAIYPTVQGSVSGIVSSAISNAGESMLKICAFTVFFAVVGDALCATLRHYLGNTYASLGAAVCELTLGAREAAALGGSASRVLCAFGVGWSGISVHMQTASLLADSGLSMRRYYLCKLLQGILTASLVSVFSYFSPGGTQ